MNTFLARLSLTELGERTMPSVTMPDPPASGELVELGPWLPPDDLTTQFGGTGTTSMLINTLPPSDNAWWLEKYLEMLRINNKFLREYNEDLEKAVLLQDERHEKLVHSKSLLEAAEIALDKAKHDSTSSAELLESLQKAVATAELAVDKNKKLLVEANDLYKERLLRRDRIYPTREGHIDKIGEFRDKLGLPSSEDTLKNLREVNRGIETVTAEILILNCKIAKEERRLTIEKAKLAAAKTALETAKADPSSSAELLKNTQLLVDALELVVSLYTSNLDEAKKDLTDKKKDLEDKTKERDGIIEQLGKTGKEEVAITPAPGTTVPGTVLV